MKTPEQIATEAIERNYEDQGAPNDYPATENLNYLLQNGEVDADGIHAMIAAAVKADRADREPTVRHIIFTGPFEEAFSMDEAERRLEELLDEGRESPTVVNAAMEGGEVLGLTVRKIIATAKAGEIR